MIAAMRCKWCRDTNTGIAANMLGYFFQNRLRQIVRREVGFKVTLQRFAIKTDAETLAVQPFDAAPFGLRVSAAVWGKIDMRISVVLVHFDVSLPCVVARHCQSRISGMSSPYCRMQLW